MNTRPWWFRRLQLQCAVLELLLMGSLSIVQNSKSGVDQHFDWWTADWFHLWHTSLLPAWWLSQQLYNSMHGRLESTWLHIYWQCWRQGCWGKRHCVAYQALNSMKHLLEMNLLDTTTYNSWQRHQRHYVWACWCHWWSRAHYCCIRLITHYYKK